MSKCRLCNGEKLDWQVYCGAGCNASWESGLRHKCGCCSKLIGESDYDGIRGTCHPCAARQSMCNHGAQ